MEEVEDARFTRPRIKKNYQLLKGECDRQWDTGGGEAADGEGSMGGINQTPVTSRFTEEMEPPDRQRQVEAENRRSPSDPRRPIKLKMIPRSIQMARSGSASGSGGNSNGGSGGGGGAHRVATRSPSVPCTTASAGGVCPVAGVSRATHSAVVHASGAHSLLRNPPPFLPTQQGHQTPTGFPSTIMRCGRRCSSPQTPMLAGCLPYLGRMPPRSAQTSPSAPKSPKLTSSNSDPWSAIITKTYRTQSIGGGIPPGEMDWLPAPSPCSRKSSWSSQSTDYDSSPCW